MEQFLKENELAEISVRQVGQNNVCTTGNSVTIHFQNFSLTQCLEKPYSHNSSNINPDVLKSLIPIFENYRVERFEIKIKSHGGMINLDVHPMDTIQSIKLKLQLVYGILFNKQYLIFEEKVLEDVEKLQDCKLSDASLLHMVYSLEETGTVVFFKRILGRLFCLRFNQETTIRDVKAKIEETEEIPVKRQRLFLDDSTTLRDECRIVDYNIGKKIVKIAIAVEEDEMRKVMVKSLTGKMLYLVVGLHDTVEDLKCQLEAKDGVPRESVRIIVNSSSLKDDCMLCTCFDTKVTIFHQFRRLKGGEEFTLDLGIRTAIGEIISLGPVPFNAKILAVKQQVFQARGLSVWSQRLFIVNEELDNNKALKDYFTPRKNHPPVVLEILMMMM